MVQEKQGRQLLFSGYTFVHSHAFALSDFVSRILVIYVLSFLEQRSSSEVSKPHRSSPPGNTHPEGMPIQDVGKSGMLGYRV